MKVLICSIWGGGTALGWRFRKEGHQVKMWIKPHDGKQSDVGDGFIDKVTTWEEAKGWADFIVVDDGGMGKLSESFKKEGKVVWGGSEWSDQIELDRGLGQKTLKEVGMTIIPSQEFTNIDQAMTFVKSKPNRYVVKPSGPIQDEKALTYVGKQEDGSDLIATLEQYKLKWSGKIKKLEIQEVKKGVEVGISGFFNGKDFVDPIEISFEHKKLMNGNIGPSTGEMGTSMVWMARKKIYKESIGRMVKTLAEHNYTGYIDINCIAEGKTLWPLEFTTRFGYPTIQMKLETLSGNLCDTMYQVARGDKKNFKISNPYSICVVMATPPYPFESEEIFKKYGEDQMVIFNSKDRTGICPTEVKRDKENNWYLAGGSGFSLICTGQGKNIKEAQKMAYKRVESVTIPNSMWRTDIGDKTEEDLKKLHSFGWFD